LVSSNQQTRHRFFLQKIASSRSANWKMLERCSLMNNMNRETVAVSRSLWRSLHHSAPLEARPDEGGHAGEWGVTSWNAKLVLVAGVHHDCTAPQCLLVPHSYVFKRLEKSGLQALQHTLSEDRSRLWPTPFFLRCQGPCLW
jgi:hypothetical protein